MSGAPFSHVVRVERIPPRGKRFHVEANEAERRAIADALGIVEVAALAADLDVKHLAGGDVGVRGTLTATVSQTDVVTLEPVRQEMVEEIDVTLAAAEEAGGRKRKAVEEETPGDERDLYERGEIDLGAIAVEHLVLGLDPYPRAAGVAFEGHVEDAAGAAESPFAELRRLKRDGE